MSSSRLGLGWLVSAAAPWAVSCGLLVSFTATAGYGPERGGGPALLKRDLAREHVDFVLAITPGLASADIRLASLGGFGAPPPAIDTSGRSLLGQALPRADLKKGVVAFPLIDRRAKGDPLIALRPSLTRARIAPGEAERLVRADLFRDAPIGPATGRLRPFDQPPPDLFEWAEPQDDTAPITHVSQARPSPPQAAASTPPTPSRHDGASPPAPRASALASTTPAPADAVPIAIAAAPVSLPPPRPPAPLPEVAAPVAAPEPRSRFADLIEPARLDRETRCLAEAVYFEARNEPEEGQAAVAQVVLNRVKSGLYPGNVCGVVYQNRHRYLACQFTFACEGKSLRITEPEPWAVALRVAEAVIAGTTYLAKVGAATHYHATYVLPGWAKRLKKNDKVGRHVFYQLKPGQT